MGSSGFDLRPEGESELCSETLFTAHWCAIKPTSPAAVQCKITMVIKSDVYSARRTWHINCTGWSILYYFGHSFTSFFFFARYSSLIWYIYIIFIYSNTIKVSHCEICHPYHSGEIPAQPTQCPWPDRFTLHDSARYVCVGGRWGVSSCLWLQMFSKSERGLLTNRKNWCEGYVIDQNPSWWLLLMTANRFRAHWWQFVKWGL